MFGNTEIAFQLEIQEHVERLQGYRSLIQYTNMPTGEKSYSKIQK
jgi:hypothetical protein